MSHALWMQPISHPWAAVGTNYRFAKVAPLGAGFIDSDSVVSTSHPVGGDGNDDSGGGAGWNG